MSKPELVKVEPMKGHRATQSTHSDAQAPLNQVDTYSEFLNELARQRHTLIRYRTEISDYKVSIETIDAGIKDIDQLVRDTLEHIEKVSGKARNTRYDSLQ